MSEKQQPEVMDTWPEVVAVLDRYSMEAWRAGVIAERERIIKLLEDQQIRFISNGFWTEGVAVRASVALIKGENK